MDDSVNKANRLCSLFALFIGIDERRYFRDCNAISFFLYKMKVSACLSLHLSVTFNFVYIVTLVGLVPIWPYNSPCPKRELMWSYNNFYQQPDLRRNKYEKNSPRFALRFLPFSRRLR